MAEDEKLPPPGRLARLRKLAGLSASLGTKMLVQGARRLAGDTPALLTRETAERLVATLGDLKGAAMKMGQMLSMEPELFSAEVQAVLARLQNQAPSMSSETVVEVLTRELGAPPDERFAEFDVKPFAAASLGQVHRAKLPDGRAVAVKVQYPGIEQALQSDLDNLGLVVKALGATHRLLDGRWFYEEVKRELGLEVDYRGEAERCRAFALAAQPFPDLRVPQVVESHSSERVFTLELLDGPTLKEYFERESSNADRFRVSRLLIRALQGPFLWAAQAHADPHPGNFLVMPNGQLGILDFGAVKRLTPPFVAAAREMLRLGIGVSTQDPLTLCREAGFTFELPQEEAGTLLRGLIGIAQRSIASSYYDYGRCHVVPDLRRYGAEHALRLLKIRPPREGLLYFRAVGGLVQNLRRLGATGDFRAVHAELLDLAPG